MGGDAADVGDRVRLDAEQHEPGAVGRLRLERHPGEAEEAGRIARRQEGLDEGGLDQVEVGLAVVVRMRRRIGEMRRLPLRAGLGSGAWLWPGPGAERGAPP